MALVPAERGIAELLDKAVTEARGDARDLATLLSRFASAQGSSNKIVNNVREFTVSAAGRKVILPPFNGLADFKMWS